MSRSRLATLLILLGLFLSACGAASPTASTPTEPILIDTGGGRHSGLLAGGCRIEMDAPTVHSGHFTPFDTGDPFEFDLPGNVESLTLELRPFDPDSGQPGDPVRSQPVVGAASRISLALNADPGWYILVLTVNLPDGDCAVYWFPVGVTA